MQPPLSHFTSPDFWSFYSRLPARVAFHPPHPHPFIHPSRCAGSEL